MKPRFLLLLAGVTSLALVVYLLTGKEETSRQFRASGVSYPENFRDTFVRYATIDRIDGTVRDIYISPDALDNLSGRGALPDGSVILVDAYYAQHDADGELLFDEVGHLIKGEPFEMFHVLEKRADWQPEAFVSDARVGNWNFGSFETHTGKPFDENLTGCFHCHNPAAQTDFVYSLPLLARFLLSNEVQYFYCDLPDRLAC